MKKWEVYSAGPSLMEKGQEMWKIAGPLIVNDYEDWGFTKEAAEEILQMRKEAARYRLIMLSMEEKTPEGFEEAVKDAHTRKEFEAVTDKFIEETGFNV